MKPRAIVKTLIALTVFYGILAAAQNKGTFQAGINYPAGFPTVPSNTGFLLGGISPFEAHAQDSKGNPLDFNGDGKPDIVVAASCALGTGNGSYGIPNCPASNYAVVVYLSNGDGTFGSPIISGGVAQELRSIAVGDFNGDGKLDIAAVSDCNTQDCSSGSMIILMGNGDGTFTPGAYYALGSVVSQANTITVGDLNGDGKPDVVVGASCYNIAVNGCSVGAVEVFVGNGDGTFQSPNIYLTSGNGAIVPVVGDFNKDGKQDVLAAIPGNALAFFPGNGDGTLGTPSSTSLPGGGASITAADFNSDGNLDVAVAGGTGSLVIFGNGDGTFQTPAQYSLNIFTTSIVAADMNGDGKPDLIVGGSTSNSLNAATVLLNDGTGNFSNISTFFAGGCITASLGVADFNGDGKNDIVLVSGASEDQNVGGSDGSLSVLLGNGDGTMRSAQYMNESPDGTNGIAARAAAAADFNGDGFQDLIFPSGCGAGDSCAESGFTLLLSNGAGGYQAPLNFTAPVNGATFLAVADFNGDGKPDVAVFNSCDASCTGTSVSIFLNTGNGTFSDPVVYEGGDVSPLSIATGDFNGDGKPDIAILEYSAAIGENTIGVLLGNGDGTFQPVVTQRTGAGNTAYWIASADFNGDGKTDLVLTENTNNPSNPYENSAQILISNGDGTFSFGALYDSGGGRGGLGVSSVTTGDLNGDGKADIVIGNLCEPVVRGQIAYDVNCASGSIGVLLGNGDGTFQYGPSYNIPDANFFSISLADVNGDGKLDYVASTATGVAVSFGNGDGSFQLPTVYAALEALQNVQLAIADLNGDGALDIVQPGVSGQLAILYNQGFTKAAPTVSLQSSLNPSTFGQTTTFTATVTSTSGVPTGTVTFFLVSNSTHKGPATLPIPLVNGSASYSANGFSAGTYSITASYSGDANNSPAVSAPLQQVVNQGTTSVVLLSSADPSYVNQNVTFTATVTTQYGGAATGSITFKQGTTTIATATIANGQAIYNTTYTTTGTRSITAVYSGDSNNLGSTSGVVKQAVRALPAATTTVVATSGSPTFIHQPATFTATVTSTDGSIPDGESVAFSDGSTPLVSVPLAGGIATYTTSALKAGTHTIKASYSGDVMFKASVGSVKQIVSLYPSAVSAPSSNLNPSNFGQAVTFSVTVTSSAPSTPTGTVTFKNGTTSIGSGTVGASGIATLTKANLPVGSLSITAVYNGDAETAKSTSPATNQTVNQATTTASVSSSRNPSTSGQTVKFTAVITSPTTTPTGSVTFMDGSNVLATVTLAGSKASYATSALSTGSHNITAVYAGTSNIVGSTSPILAETIN